MRQDALLVSLSSDDPYETACLERQFLTFSMVDMIEKHKGAHCIGYKNGGWCTVCAKEYDRQGMMGDHLRHAVDRMTRDPLWQEPAEQDTGFDPLEFEAQRAIRG